MTATTVDGPSQQPAPGPSARAQGQEQRRPPCWSRSPSCVALIPLVWLLWTVISKGLHAITRNGWLTREPARDHLPRPRRRRAARDHRHARAGRCSAR